MRQLIKEWLKAHRDLTPKYVGEMLAVSGTIQVYMLGITAAAGLAATAGIRGAQVLLGPVNVLNQGIRMIAVPEAARALKHSYRRLWLVGLAISLGVGAGALAWGAVFLLLPEVVGRQLLGPGVWAQARTVMVPVILLQAFGASNAGAFAIMRALTAATRGLQVRLVSSIILIIAACRGSFSGRPQGCGLGPCHRFLLHAVAVVARSPSRHRSSPRYFTVTVANPPCTLLFPSKTSIRYICDVPDGAVRSVRVTVGRLQKVEFAVVVATTMLLPLRSNR